MKTFLTCLISLGLLTLSCTKSKNELKEGYEKFSYAQTGCSDAWTTGLTDETTIINVKNFLEERNIPVDEIWIEKFSDGPFCLACNCPTGKKIFVIVPEENKDELVALGFQME